MIYDYKDFQIIVGTYYLVGTMWCNENFNLYGVLIQLIDWVYCFNFFISRPVSCLQSMITLLEHNLSTGR